MKRILYTFIATKQSGVIPTIFRVIMFPFSLLYGGVIQIRNFCYATGFIKQRKLPCQVISVGNIVAGGTGKTPAVAAIAKLFQNEGKTVALLLSGYKGKNSDEVTFVSDGEKQLCTREECGDEAEMLTQQLVNIPIVVGKQRYQSGKAALNRFKCDLLILDDGFQHRKLSRDLDILTIDATQPFGTGVMLPIGTLREPKSAIQRADIILLTRTDAENTNIDELKTELKRLAENTPILGSIHKPTALYKLSQPGEKSFIPIDSLTGKRLLAVCGIGNPMAFVITLQAYNPDTVELIDFPDHHAYTETDLQQITQRYELYESDLVVTTQKDEQKLASLSSYLPIVVLAIELVITDGIDILKDALTKR